MRVTNLIQSLLLYLWLLKDLIKRKLFEYLFTLTSHSNRLLKKEKENLIKSKYILIAVLIAVVCGIEKTAISPANPASTSVRIILNARQQHGVQQAQNRRRGIRKRDFSLT